MYRGWGDADREAVHEWEQGVYWKSLYLLHSLAVNLKLLLMGIPWWPVGWTSPLYCWGPRFSSWSGNLGSHKLFSIAEKKHRKPITPHKNTVFLYGKLHLMYILPQKKKKWIKGLNIKLKLLEENIGRKSLWLWVKQRGIRYNTKSIVQRRKKMINWTIKTENCSSKILIKKTKRQATYWVKFANHLSNKGLVSWIYKELSKLF